MSSKKSTQPLKHGEEPTELLLALASSPIETLCQRKAAQLFLANTQDGKPAVLAIFLDATLEDDVIVLAKRESVGNTSANTEIETVEELSG